MASVGARVERPKVGGGTGLFSVRIDISDTYFVFWTQTVQQRFRSASLEGVLMTAEAVKQQTQARTPVLTRAAQVSWEVEMDGNTRFRGSKAEFERRFVMGRGTTGSTRNRQTGFVNAAQQIAVDPPHLTPGFSGQNVFSAVVVSRANHPEALARRPGRPGTPPGAYYVGWLEEGYLRRDGKTVPGHHMLAGGLAAIGVGGLQNRIRQAWHSQHA